MKLRFLLLCMISIFSLGAYAQSKQLQFTILDSKTKEPVSFAVLQFKYKGITIGGVQLNFDGKGTFSYLDTLDERFLKVEIRCPGYPNRTFPLKNGQNNYVFDLENESPFAIDLPPNPMFLLPPGQVYYDAEFIQRTAYR